MKRAQKIFEAHVYTVSAHSDPMVQAIQSDLFPIIENYLAQKDMITESTDNLSWEQIVGVFKAAEKLTGGGVLQRASKATSSFKNAVQGKVSEILSKYQSSAPVSDAEAKVDKLSNKAMQAIEANVPPEEQSDSKYAIKRLRMLSRKVPEAASAVIGLLSTVLSYANSEKAAELIPALASSGADAIEDTDYERMEPVVGDLTDVDTDHDADTMPRMPTFQKSVNKDDRRAKKGDRKQGITKQSGQGGLYAER